MHKIAVDPSVKPEEVLFVRQEEKNSGSIELWRNCIEEALCVVTARDAIGQIFGIGFLVGNHRHGQIVDLSVHSSARQNGLGGKIFDALVSHSREIGIIYLGLTWDTRHPWLKAFYERHGFRTIDFAMWDKESLETISES